MTKLLFVVFLCFFVVVVVVVLDGKSYDAFLMCYESDTDSGLKDCDIKWLMRGLEDRFGYNLCLYDRDVSPGEGTYLMFLPNLP